MNALVTILHGLFWIIFAMWIGYGVIVTWNRFGPKGFFIIIGLSILVGLITGLMLIWLGNVS